MKQIVMAVLMFTIASCAVETAPTEASTTSPAEQADSDQPEQARSTPDRDADPHAVNCPFACESLTQCRASGGIVHGACIFPGTVCCEL